MLNQQICVERLSMLEFVIVIDSAKQISDKPIESMRYPIFGFLITFFSSIVHHRTYTRYRNRQILN